MTNNNRGTSQVGKKPERIRLGSLLQLTQRHTHWFDLGWLSLSICVCVCVNSLLSLLTSVKGSVCVCVCETVCKTM